MGWPRRRPALALWTMSADTRVYEIRVQGELAPRWSCWFAGLAVQTSDGETVIVGPVDDQAALHGCWPASATSACRCWASRVIDG